MTKLIAEEVKKVGNTGINYQELFTLYEEEVQ